MTRTKAAGFQKVSHGTGKLPKSPYPAARETGNKEAGKK